MDTNNQEITLETRVKREQTLLGCAIAFPKDCLEPLMRADEADFADLNHKVIFSALKSLYDQKIPVDQLTLKEKLNDKVETDYLLALQESTISPEASNFEYHLNQLVPIFSPDDFPELISEDLLATLGLTIKKDNSNKLITFLAMLSAFTENDQLNISFNAPSSTGKSYIPLETAQLFPQEDMVIVAYCSPTAFFHDYGIFDKEKRVSKINLHRKIIVFLDQPHTLLLQHLRPLLSHDKKEIQIKITDKSQKYGMRTKNIIIVGYPTVIFCTAGLKIDEQEATRFLLLSPDIDQDKIQEAIFEKVKKATDYKLYQEELEGNEGRALLKQRIIAIKRAKIKEIQLNNPEKVLAVFNDKNLKPRHMRDVTRLISLTKAFALLNLWHRERSGFTVKTNENDIKEALELWDKISEAQELNLPPYVYVLFKEVIKPACDAYTQGVSRRTIMQRHFEVYQRPMPEWQLRNQILPMLATAGLITEEPDELDKRKMLIRCV